MKQDMIFKHPTMWPDARRSYSKAIDLPRLKRDVAWKLDLAEKQRHLSERVSNVRQDIGHCPVCNSSDALTFALICDYRYKECCNCGHIYMSNPPCADTVRQLYSGDVNANSSLQEEIYISDDVFNIRVDTIAGPKAAFVKKATNTEGAEWLDIGCGVGELVLAAKDLGYKAAGIDSSLNECEYGRRKGADIRHMDISGNNLAAAEIDKAEIVSLLNFLEHQLRPREFISDLASLMKTGSWLIIEVPRHPSLSSFINRVFPDLAVRHIYPPDHLHIFTEKFLDILLTEANLSVEHVWLFGQYFLEIIFSLACLDPVNSMDPYEEFIRSANIIQSCIDAENLSDIIFLVARKR
jgi:2-polyprenyl-3-methyl-5-hydroxy-6-metoxy-1,4-benzoquinol methylase